MQSVDDAKRRGALPPLPSGAPLLALEDAAAFLRLTPGALRKELDAGDSVIGQNVRGWIVALSPRRRYVKAAPFLGWLRDVAGEAPVKADATILKIS